MFHHRHIFPSLIKISKNKTIRFVSQKPIPKNATSLHKSAAGFVEKPDPQTIDQDHIGPADNLSNLRPIVRHIPKNETPLQQRLREKQNEVEAWNFDFWTRHNKRFYEEKDDFVRLHKLAGITDLSADKMSVFYKTFLDKNRKLHVYYNMSWYLKNLDLLVLAFQVQVQKLFLRKKLKK